MPIKIKIRTKIARDGTYKPATGDDVAKILARDYLIELGFEEASPMDKMEFYNCHGIRFEPELTEEVVYKRLVTQLRKLPSKQLFAIYIKEKELDERRREAQRPRQIEITDPEPVGIIQEPEEEEQLTLF